MNTIESYFQHYLHIKERENFPNGFKDLPHRIEHNTVCSMLEEAYKAGFKLCQSMNQSPTLNKNKKKLKKPNADIHFSTYPC